MAVNRYKFDIFTSTYKVDIHYGHVYIKYVYDYENEYIVNMHIAPPSWDYINIESRYVLYVVLLYFYVVF